MKKYRKWTDEDKQYLRDNYGRVPVERLAEKFGVAKATIYYTANKLGIKHPSRVSVETEA